MGEGRQISKDDIATIGEIARRLSISRTTAYVMARAGELPVKWRGGRFEMLRVDLEALALTRHAIRRKNSKSADAP